ncbi:MAG: hypothetical protein JSU66_02935 [Deltaproteobacteria bacterium]|nr:MAG: hypothetical protein JSU66_02935 [Deltaproteobacteria bacterium]
MPRRWRLICDGAASGAWNMGVDEALLESVRAGGDPILRLYRWNGPWLSIGYGQRPGAARLCACREAGVGVVRRATGGAAVLHGGDLTYAVAAREEVVPGGLQASYRRITEILSSALAALGVDTQRVVRGAPDPRARDFDCFAEPAPDELCVGGRKLLGSAQRRAAGAFLQHGSLRVVPDAASAAGAAGLAADRATSLVEQGYEGGFEPLCRAIVRAAGTGLDAVFQGGPLAETERALARERCAAHALDPLAPPPGLPRDASRERMDDR